MNLGEAPALVVVDMQNGYVSPDGFLSRLGLDCSMNAGTIPSVRRLLEIARRNALPVVFTRYSLNADYSDAGLLTELLPGLPDTGGMVRDTWDTAICEEVAPIDDELVIDKTRYSAFFATELESRLRGAKIDTLIVCGVTTECCVESTVRDAFFRDFRIIVARDAVAAASQQRHDDALRVMETFFGTVATVDEVEDALTTSQLASRS